MGQREYDIFMQKAPDSSGKWVYSLTETEPSAFAVSLRKLHTVVQEV